MGLFVQVTTIPRHRNSTKHSTSSADATSMAPYTPTASEHPFHRCYEMPTSDSSLTHPSTQDCIVWHGCYVPWCTKRRMK